MTFLWIPLNRVILAGPSAAVAKEEMRKEQGGRGGHDGKEDLPS
jgi:hypothetical protein